MPSSETAICNLALAHLGEARIESLDEDNLASRACALHYGPTRDMVLRSHRWNFAQARVTLSESADAPAFGPAHQYPLPSDCLRVLECNETEDGDVISNEYPVEGRCIVTNADTLNLVYVKRIEDVSQFDALFVEAFALKLAIVLSETIRGTTGKTADLAQQYEQKTGPLARRVDANEGRRRKGLIAINSQAIRARGGGIDLSSMPLTLP